MGLMEGLSEYFSFLSVADGGFSISHYCYAKCDFMSESHCWRGKNRNQISVTLQCVSQ